MSRPRVLQVITRLGLGGAEKVALSLVHGLRTEADLAVFTVYPGCHDAVGTAMRRDLAAAGVPWFQGTALPVKLGGMLTGAFALSRAVAAFRPDVVHYHAEPGESCGATLAALSPAFARRPALRTIHNSLFWHYWPRIGRWCDRQLAPARIACVSAAAHATFQPYRLSSGAPPADPAPVIIYNGVAPPAPLPAPRLPGSTIRVLFAGRFVTQKGVDLLCHALPEAAPPTGRRAHLVALGHGVEEPLLRALAERPPPGWSVEIRPPVGDLGRVLPDFDLVVMPSRFEGLGLVAVEATLAGLPVVATAAAGLRETLPDSHPWLARPDDAADLARVLRQALAESDRWPSVTERARAFALARFAPERMVAAYRELYLAAAARPTPA